MARRAFVPLIASALSLLMCGWHGAAVTIASVSCAANATETLRQPLCSVDDAPRVLNPRVADLRRVCYDVLSASRAGVIPSKLPYSVPSLLLPLLEASGAVDALVQCCAPHLLQISAMLGPSEACLVLGSSIARVQKRVESNYALGVNGLLTGLACTPERWNTKAFPSLAPVSSLDGAAEAACAPVPEAATGSSSATDPLEVATRLEGAGLPDVTKLYSAGEKCTSSCGPARPDAASVLLPLQWEAVRRSVYHAYAGYERWAWDADVLLPAAQRGKQHLCKSGETLVDALDTLILAHLPAQVQAARAWVAANLTVPRTLQQPQYADPSEVGAAASQTASAAPAAMPSNVPLPTDSTTEDNDGRPDLEGDAAPAARPPPPEPSAWADVNLFESTIRIVGGLLAAHELSERPVAAAATNTAAGELGFSRKGDAAKSHLFLQRAEAVMASFVSTGAFDTPTGYPYGTLSIDAPLTATRPLNQQRSADSLPGPGVVGPGGTAHNPSWIRGYSSISEVGTLSLELLTLARLTGNLTYSRLSHRITRNLLAAQPPDGLYPIYVDPQTGQYMNAQITLGARGDSLYEYLLKTWLLLRGDDWREEKTLSRAAAAWALQVVLDNRLATFEEESEDELITGTPARDGKAGKQRGAPLDPPGASRSLGSPTSAASLSTPSPTAPVRDQWTVACRTGHGNDNSVCTATPSLAPSPHVAQETVRIQSPPAQSVSAVSSVVAASGAITGAAGGLLNDESLLHAFSNRVTSAIEGLLSVDEFRPACSSGDCKAADKVLQSPEAPGSPADRRVASLIRSGISTRALLRGYNNAVCGIMDRLLQISSPSGFYYVAEALHSTLADQSTDPALDHKMDHLVCFLPGVLALGAHYGAGHETLATEAVSAIRRKAALRASERFFTWALNASFARQTRTGPLAAAPSVGPQHTASSYVGVPGLDVTVPLWTLIRPLARRCSSVGGNYSLRSRRHLRRQCVGRAAVRLPFSTASEQCFCSSEHAAVADTSGCSLLQKRSPVERALGLPDDTATTGSSLRSPSKAVTTSLISRLASDVLAAMIPLLDFADEAVAAGGGYKLPPRRPRAQSDSVTSASSPEPAKSLANSRGASTKGTSSPVGGTASGGSLLRPGVGSHAAPNASAIFPPPRPYVHPVFAEGAGVGARGTSFCGMLDPANATATLLRTAHELARTCAALYARSPTGLAPEIVTFDDAGSDFAPNADALHSLLRPEALESFFVLHRLSGSRTGSVYQRWAWRVFEAFEARARVFGGGYTSVRNVSDARVRRPPRGAKAQAAAARVHMESFFLAESLKYLLLTFDSGRGGGAGRQPGSAPADSAAPEEGWPAPHGAGLDQEDEEEWRWLLPGSVAADVGDGQLPLPLGEWVLNTEAHPLRRWPPLAHK